MFEKLRQSLFFRRLVVLAGLGLAAGAGVMGLIWFQDAPLREARALLDAGDAQAAAELVGDWEESHTPTGRSQALRARCYVAFGRHAEAISVFQNVGAETIEEIHDWARAHLSLQQWVEALPLLRELRNREPDNPDVLHELASCLAQLKYLDEALEVAAEFGRHKEYAHRAWLLTGVLQRQKGNKEKAAAAWEQIAATDPDYGDLQIPADEFLTQFASLSIELGRLDEADRLLQRALALRDTAEANFQAGLLAELQGRQSAADEHWAQAIALNPHHLNAREALARSAIAAGDGARAESLLKPLLGSSPERSSTTYLMQRALLLRGDQVQAAHWQQVTETLRQREQIDDAVSQLLRENPTSFWAQVIRSYQFAEQGSWEQADKILQSLPPSDNEDGFVADLRRAVRRRSALPSTDRLPIKLF